MASAEVVSAEVVRGIGNGIEAEADAGKSDVSVPSRRLLRPSPTEESEGDARRARCASLDPCVERFSNSPRS